MTYCPKCNAELSAWEVRSGKENGVIPCWCEGIPPKQQTSLGHLAFAELCDPALSKPVRTHDILRFIGPKYQGDARHSINVALQDRRFCWGGRSLYGLMRHGLIPGPRSLAQVAYAVLLAAPRKLYIDEVDFVLEQLNYRFHPDSLAHHLRGYTGNRWNLAFQVDDDHRVSVHSGRSSRHHYNEIVQGWPTNRGFDRWLEENFAPKVALTLADRADRLSELQQTGISLPGDRIEF